MYVRMCVCLLLCVVSLCVCMVCMFVCLNYLFLRFVIFHRMLNMVHSFSSFVFCAERFQWQTEAACKRGKLSDLKIVTCPKR